MCALVCLCVGNYLFAPLRLLHARPFRLRCTQILWINVYLRRSCNICFWWGHNGAPSLAFTVYVRALRGITISNSRARRRRQQTMKHYTFACNSSNVNRTNWFSSIRRRTHFTCHCSVNFTLGDYRIGFSSLFSFSSASASFVVVDRRGRRAYILCFGPSKNNNKIIATECRQQQPRNSAINGYIITSIELLAFTVRSPTSSVTYMRCLLYNDADDDISIQRIRSIFRVFRICASAFPSRSSNEIHRPKKESKEDEEAERGKTWPKETKRKSIRHSAVGVDFMDAICDLRHSPAAADAKQPNTLNGRQKPRGKRNLYSGSDFQSTNTTYILHRTIWTGKTIYRTMKCAFIGSAHDTGHRFSIHSLGLVPSDLHEMRWRRRSHFVWKWLWCDLYLLCVEGGK